MSEETTYTTEVGEDSTGTGLARPRDILPNRLYFLPTTARPMFPSQIVPVLLDEGRWSETIQAIHSDEQAMVVGVIYTDVEELSKLTWENIDNMGTACRIHKVHIQDGKIHLVLSGEKRFRIIDWVSKTAPYYAQVKYFPEVGETDTLEIKAYVTAVINTIKELLPLNPLYGEELKIFVQNFRPDDPFRLADFG